MQMPHDKIKTPFAQDMVQALNEYQTATNDGLPMHPLVCVNRDDHFHGNQGGSLGLLIATHEGWVCPSCDHSQAWAETFMVDAAHLATIEKLDGRNPSRLHLEKALRALSVQQDYMRLSIESPGASGVDVMISCMDIRCSVLVQSVSVELDKTLKNQDGNE